MVAELGAGEVLTDDHIAKVSVVGVGMPTLFRLELNLPCITLFPPFESAVAAGKLSELLSCTGCGS